MSPQATWGKNNADSWNRKSKALNQEQVIKILTRGQITQGLADHNKDFGVFCVFFLWWGGS